MLNTAFEMLILSTFSTVPNFASMFSVLGNHFDGVILSCWSLGLWYANYEDVFVYRSDYS